MSSAIATPTPNYRQPRSERPAPRGGTPESAVGKVDDLVPVAMITEQNAESERRRDVGDGCAGQR